MSDDPASLLVWAPAFALVLARVGATMALLPGLGEAEAPSIVRVGAALALTILLVPEVQPLVPHIPEAGLGFALIVGGEVVTGLWFGWVARLIALALPAGAQFIAYLIGLASVLQPDPELGAQSTALGKLFDLAVPVMILSSGLYTLQLKALVGLFHLIPPGHLLPPTDGADVAIRAVGTTFALALQIASPFVLASIVWHVIIGQLARAGGRMQIYFASMPGQILGGLALLAMTGSAILIAWRDGAADFLGSLPGGN